MKRTIIVCDVTGKESITLAIKERIGDKRHARIDAAGSLDEDYEPRTIELDLSHEGAIKLLENIIRAAHKCAKSYSVTASVIGEAIEQTTAAARIKG